MKKQKVDGREGDQHRVNSYENKTPPSGNGSLFRECPFLLVLFHDDYHTLYLVLILQLLTDLRNSPRPQILAQHFLKNIVF